MDEVTISVRGVSLTVCPPSMDDAAGEKGKITPDQWAALIQGILNLILSIFFPKPEAHKPAAPTQDEKSKK